jgi:signal transduction histidine kinase
MTGQFYLDWAIMAVSLFNTILLLWLGLTVLLNAERRAAWGIWLASGGLLMGGAFFVSHSAILGHGADYFSQGMNFWWRVGWLPVAGLPFAWYAMILWYTGFWDRWHAQLRDRHLTGLLVTALLAAGSIGLLLFANPIPSFTQVTQLDLWAAPAVRGKPLLILIYPPYIVLCIALSLDALRHPGPSGRVMGDLARRRARPWLVAASIALLLASLLVALVVVRIVLFVRRNYVVTTDAVLAIGRSDLIIAALIALATLALGQAIVSYEVFTGKTLPRGGLRRYWRNAVVLAAGYGLVMGWSLTWHLRAIYSLLTSALLMTLFYALLSWRSYVERERYIAHLRPFVASQRLYEHLLTASASAPHSVDAATPFGALCADVLGARVAYLAALGPLAPLVGPPLAYPGHARAALPPLAEITEQFRSPQTISVPLDPARYGGATWAVPLWSERGLIGVLLLGEKQAGGLYTQEEIEIARASGERLIDTQASAEMARRLMALQRQRLAESQVLDRRARRALHDDVLPRLHTAMLTLSGEDPDSEAVTLLGDVHRYISDLLREMPTSTAPEVARLGLVGALRRAVDDELGNAFDQVTWQVEPGAEQQARQMPSLTAEVLFYAAREAVRNAARHGRDAARPLHLEVKVIWRDGLQIVVEDNGIGLEVTKASGEGGGQGLVLHSTMMAVVGGSLAVESAPGAYTRVTLALPWTTDR